jgi:protein SCO1/2
MTYIKVPGRAFDLIDHFGRQVTNEAFYGKYLLVFFGFTHCRVVCPRALARLSAALEAIGPLTETIQPLYITVDPERDTPGRMRNFLQPYPQFLGLTGSREQIDDAKRAFRVFAQRVPDPEDSENYAVPHTAITYLLGPSGIYLAHFLEALPAADISSRLKSHIERVDATVAFS